MTMLLNLASAVALTATGAGPAIRCHVSPFLGGQGKNALLINNAALAGGAIVNVEGNPLAGATAPAGNDPGWAAITTLNAASPLEQEIQLPLWVRYNITTVGTGTLTLALEGVQ